MKYDGADWVRWDVMGLSDKILEKEDALQGSHQSYRTNLSRHLAIHIQESIDWWKENEMGRILDMKKDA